MKLVWIRHGETAGNLKKQYIGSTDEVLSEIGKKNLLGRSYPLIDRLIISPMKRCQQTAQLIYQDQPYQTVEAFKECDFGAFEGKSYEQLKENSDYIRWLESCGRLPFPDGESADEFKKRCCQAFEEIIEDCKADETVGFVVHGGTIMAILEAYGQPQKSFYDYQIKNGKGYMAAYDKKKKEMTRITAL